MQFYNYIVDSINTPLTVGHLPANDLLANIKKHKGEGYHSLFNMEKRDTYVGYQGPISIPLGWFPLDFDSESLEAAKADVLRLWQALSLDSSHARIYFSGRKGFHVYIRQELLRDISSVQAVRTCVVDWKARFALPTLDVSIIQAGRKFRLPNSKHNKTPYYKVELDYEQLTDWSIDQIKAFASQPREITLEQYSIPNPSSHLGSGPATATHAESVRDAGEVVGPGVFGTEHIISEDTQYGQFKDKVCIKRMWEATLIPGERHATILALIGDAFETGEAYDAVSSRLRAWAIRNSVIDRWDTDILRALDERYDGRRTHSYGCYSPTKSAHCSRACPLYSRLNPALRNQNPADTEEVIREEEKKQQAKKEEPASEDTKAHITIVNQLLRKYRSNITKQDKDVFIYKGTHWEEATTGELDSLKKEMHLALGFVQNDKLEKCWKMLQLYIPSVPRNVDMYQPNPMATNFKNGTLFIKRTNGQYALEFRPHNRADYVTNCLAVDYKETTGQVNTRFGDLIAHALKNDAEKDQKIRALKQMAGAMLVPSFPQIFFLLGASGSGKSTITKIFFRLIGGNRVCGFVQPCDMHGFMLEGLLHKTVNVHTDVDENKVIPDSFFKSSGDRVPMQVNRKGRKVVQSYIPAVHVFCANSMPPTQVKVLNVYDRRMTIIKLDNVVKEAIDQYEDLILEENPQALVEFALEGLKDLVGSGGFYFKPESSKKNTKAWQERSSDSIDDFLDCVAHEEVLNIKLVKEATITKADVFSAYSQWCTEQGYRDVPFKAAKFSRELEARGFQSVKVEGSRMLRGITKLELGPENSRPKL